MNKFLRNMMMHGSAIALCCEGEGAQGGNNGAGAGGANAGGQGGQKVEGSANGGAGAPTIAFLPNATPEDVTYVQSKGWDKSTNPAEDILKSYRHLEKLNGAVAGGKAIIPPEENATPEEKAAFYNKLGRPETVEGYEIKDPFKGMDETTAAGLVKLGHELGFTKAQMQGIQKWNNENTDVLTAKLESDALVENAKQVEALDKEWGAAKEENLQLARQAATAFGITPDQLTELQTVMGYDGVMKFMHKIGSGIGEGKFVTAGGTPRGGADAVMTPSQAQAELSRLGQDPAFTKAWMNKDDVGHKAAVDKKTQLTKWAYPNG